MVPGPSASVFSLALGVFVFSCIFYILSRHVTVVLYYFILIGGPTVNAKSPLTSFLRLILQTVGFKFEILIILVTKRFAFATVNDAAFI